MSRLCIIPARALDDERLTPTDLRALLAIGKHTAEDGTGVFAKRQTLADTARIHVAHFKRSVTKLVELGYVRRVRRWKKDGVPMTNLISIILDEPLPADLTAGEPVADGKGADSAPSHIEGSGIRSVGGAESAPGDGAESAPQNDSLERHPELPPTAPTPARVDTHAPADEVRPVVGLSAEFEFAEHREAYLAVRSSHRFATGFDAELKNIHQPITGGEGFAWAVIGASLMQVASNGETFNALRFRGYCRSNAQPGVMGKPWPAPNQGQSVKLGRTAITIQRFWDLCVDTGLTARGQSSSALDARLERCAMLGEIADIDALRRLVLHVEPWTLAQITFAPERVTKLRERFASFVLAHPEAA